MDEYMIGLVSGLMLGLLASPLVEHVLVRIRGRRVPATPRALKLEPGATVRTSRGGIVTNIGATPVYLSEDEHG